MILSGPNRLKTWIRDQDDATRFLSHRAASALKIVALHMSRATTFLEESNIELEKHADKWTLYFFCQVQAYCLIANPVHNH